VFKELTIRHPPARIHAEDNLLCLRESAGRYNRILSLEIVRNAYNNPLSNTFSINFNDLKWSDTLSTDSDWGATGKTHQDALDAAFKETGLPEEKFVVTKCGLDKNGKSFPVEYRHESGAEVNMDSAHINAGTDAPHVGWQTGGKQGSGGAVRGHIILDDVPYGS